jgi:pyruvate dehydrogenase E2 component (dihydrolipoamide acetyltransferase)
MSVLDFRLPDLGEGLPDGEIVRWTVRPGDTVQVNDVIAEVETVKAAVELPSPYAGVVTALLAREGETVPVGTAIISIETGEAPERPLVGYGATEQTPGRRRNRPVAEFPREREVRPVEGQPPPVAGRSPRGVLAKPPVRKLAKDLGVDLASVDGTGPDGTVTRDDIHSASRPATQDETRVPVRGVRKRTAEAMVRSAFTAPHVTLFKTADLSATMELRDRVAARREFADLKVSPLLFVAKAVLIAAARTPEMNASWGEDTIVLHSRINLGIAAATDRGLVVPNIKDAGALTLRELAEAIATLTRTARDGRTTPADLTGGTLTITSIGVFGIDAGTPIINPGESAIVAFGSVVRRPWVVGTGSDERIEPRWLTELAVSFDHRVVDGEQGATFLRDVADLLTDPGLALL